MDTEDTLHTTAERNLYATLTPEVRVSGLCARLRRSSYVTRDAPARWKAFLTAVGEHGICERVGQPMLLSARQQGLDPCCPRRRLSGVESDLEWARQQMETNIPCLKVICVGGNRHDVCDLRVLNRVLSWKSGGVQLEADPHHQEILISELEQDVRGHSGKGAGRRRRESAE